MKTLTINKVKVGSFARVVGIVQAMLGFVSGLLVTLSVTANSVNSNTHFVKSLGVSVAMLGLAVVVFPIVGFIVGWIQGAVAAVVLNFAFAESTGLQVEVEETR